MQVIIAKHSGFCRGVQRAVDEWLRSVMMNMRQAFIDRHHPRLKPLKPKKHKD